jgi:hypothetical protein
MLSGIQSLNGDVMEKIFSYLDFRDLLSAELCCTQGTHALQQQCMASIVAQHFVLYPVHQWMDGIFFKYI